MHAVCSKGAIMLRTAVWYCFGWITLVLTYPLIWIIRLAGAGSNISRHDAIASRASSWLCRVLFHLTGSSVSITGSENLPEQGAVLFVSNHQGHFDSLIIHGFISRPKGFISIVEILRIPIIRSWMRQIRCVFLDRKDARQSSECINQAIEELKSGHSMVVFPEGKLNDGKITDEFNRGWLRLATRSGVPIIPVSISGSYKILARDGSRVRAARIECVISPPQFVDKIKKTDENLFISNLRAVILSNVK
jgi:1-acyl-sn-glycerol-3-phosphate acyltransferase